MCEHWMFGLGRRVGFLIEGAAVEGSGCSGVMVIKTTSGQVKMNE